MLSHRIDAAGCSERLREAVARQAICATGRPCSKKRGGGIAPAAIGALIEAGLCSVNAFGADKAAERRPRMVRKVLTRLNFPGRPGMAKGASRKMMRSSVRGATRNG